MVDNRNHPVLTLRRINQADVQNDIIPCIILFVILALIIVIIVIYKIVLLAIYSHLSFKIVCNLMSRKRSQ